MLFKVHHADNPTFGIGPTPEFNKGNFTLVAEVKADNIEEVFALTNHIDSDWTENEGVTKAPGATRFRSTSVGDVVVADGERYLCANIGWEKF